MAIGNGKSNPTFRASGVIASSGALFGSAIRLQGNPPSEWCPVMLVLAPDNNSLPIKTRSLLTLSKEAAALFKPDVRDNRPAPLNIEVKGENGSTFALLAYVQAIHTKEGRISMLAVDSLLGLFTADAKAGTWSWRVSL
jgi:hypothetical protein